MAGLSPAHLALILIIALVVIGPGKLPEVGAAIGKSVREFQKASGEVRNTIDPLHLAPQAPVPQPPILVTPQAPAQSFYASQPAYGAEIQAQPYPPEGYYAAAAPSYAAPTGQPTEGLLPVAPSQTTNSSYPSGGPRVD